MSEFKVGFSRVNINPTLGIGIQGYYKPRFARGILDDIYANDEQQLKPTLFMQSTHNTLGSSIAIRTGCHGYNRTYSQGDDSLKWALHDARERICTGRAETVLVGCYDETPDSVDARTLILRRK